jgi:hypothetical protein
MAGVALALASELPSEPLQAQRKTLAKIVASSLPARTLCSAENEKRMRSPEMMWRGCGWQQRGTL